MTSFTHVLWCTLEAFAKRAAPNTHFSFESQTIIKEPFAKTYLELCKTVCEYEALTFLSEDSKPLYQNAKSELNSMSLQFNTMLVSQGIFVTQPFTQQQWRLFIGMACSFWEWCENTQFFSLSKAEQKTIWGENPLVSLEQFC